MESLLNPEKLIQIILVAGCVMMALGILNMYHFNVGDILGWLLLILLLYVTFDTPRYFYGGGGGEAPKVCSQHVLNNRCPDQTSDNK